MRTIWRADLSRALLLVGCLLGASCACLGQGVEEVIVTATRGEGDGGLPGTFLRKTGDFLLLQVNVRNDTREAPARKEEIYATLRNALAGLVDGEAMQARGIDPQWRAEVLTPAQFVQLAALAQPLIAGR